MQEPSLTPVFPLHTSQWIHPQLPSALLPNMSRIRPPPTTARSGPSRHLSPRLHLASLPLALQAYTLSRHSRLSILSVKPVHITQSKGPTGTGEHTLRPPHSAPSATISGEPLTTHLYKIILSLPFAMFFPLYFYHHLNYLIYLLGYTVSSPTLGGKHPRGILFTGLSQPHSRHSRNICRIKGWNERCPLNQLRKWGSPA